MKRFLPLICFVPLVASGAPVQSPDGIVRWWTGDGSATALVGEPVTLIGGPGFTAGQVGQAFDFSVAGQYGITALDAQPSALPETTWEAWVKPAVINVSGRQQILSIDTGGYGRAVLIEGGTANFGVFTGNGVWQPTAATTNEWQHIAVVFGPTNIWFYRNGVQFSYGQAPFARGSSGTLHIGRSPGYVEYFTGGIDEITIYNRALSAGEIQAIHGAGPAGKAHTTGVVADLAVSQALSPAVVSIGVGQRLTNTVTVSNLGPGTAQSVTLTVSIPTNTTVFSANSTLGTVQTLGAGVYCVPGNVAAGGTFTVTLVLSPVSVGTAVCNASVTSLAVDSNQANNSSTAVREVYGYYTATEGDWSAKEVVLENTPEAELMVRVGDIDNLGFGWPNGFDPFTGSSTPAHGFPWVVNTNDPPGTDRIMVLTSYMGTPPSGQDGYTGSTSRPANNVQSITLSFDPGSRVITSAALQIFVDDFQAPVWKAAYQVTLNGERAAFLESIINSLVQTGPIGKLITAALPTEFLPLLEQGELVLRIDDLTTGAGDGYAIDFVKLLVNLGGFAQSGTIQGTVVEAQSQQPLAGVEIGTQGISTTTTGADGKYTLTNAVAGLVSVTASLPGFATQTKLTDLVAGTTNTVNFSLIVRPVLRIELLSQNQVRVSWPGALTGYILETRSPLHGPAWGAEGSVPSMVNGWHAVTNPVQSAPRFYRLKK